MADGFNGPCGKKYSTPEQVARGRYDIRSHPSSPVHVASLAAAQCSMASEQRKWCAIYQGRH